MTTSAQAHLAVAILRLNKDSTVSTIASQVLQDALRTPGWSGVSPETGAFALPDNSDPQLREQVELLRKVFDHFCTYINSVIGDNNGLPLRQRQLAALTFRDGMRMLDESYQIPNDIVQLLAPFPDAQ